MGVFDRIRRILRARGAASSGRSRAGGGPPERADGSPWRADGSAGAEVDVAYARQLATLQEVRRSVADLMGVRRRQEGEAERIRASLARLEVEAAAAAAQGRDDDARAALAEVVRLEKQLPEIEALVGDLRAREATLGASADDLARAIEAFRLRREAAAARATAVSMEIESPAALARAGAELDEARALLDRAARS